VERAVSAPEVLDLALPSGRVRAERRGPPDGPLVLCVHGLSANLRGYDTLGAGLAAAGCRVVAIDLRGRGASEVTPPGTYGLPAHARDVLACADRLGADRFALVGWSMGAMVALHVAGVAPGRLTHVVLLDAAGPMEEAAVDAVRAGLARLDAVVPAPEAYVAAIRAAGAIVPWHEQWDGFYRYELAERDDGTWSARTSRAAAQEDLDRSLGDDLEARWGALTMPALLVRCDAPLGGGLIVPPEVGERFAANVPAGRVVSVTTNHFSLMTDDATVGAVRGAVTG
jgi:pimeloyl-ACP methyl ester carboxylesterase